MRWYHFVSYFFGAAFLTNAVPHFVNGVSGNSFQSPFATPPGVGLSSAMVNIAWASINLGLGWLLLAKVGSFDVRKPSHAVVAFLGVVGMGVLGAHSFAPLHGGL